jgi:hypothetical protein
MVGDLVGHELVGPRHGLGDQAHHDAVDGARIEDVGRVVELLVQADRDGQLLEVLGAPGLNFMIIIFLDFGRFPAKNCGFLERQFSDQFRTWEVFLVKMAIFV